MSEKESPTTSHSGLTYLDPDAESIQPLANDDTNSLDEPPLADVNALKSKKGRWLLLAVILTLTAVSAESVLLILDSFQQHWLLGSLWAAGLGLLAVVLVTFVVRELLLLMRLKKRWRQNSDETSIGQLLEQLNHPDLTHAWQQQAQSYWSEDEQRQRFEVDIVSRVDQQASRIISKRSVEAAAMVAVSPSSLADMVLLLWRSQRMMTQVARCYGVELGYWSRIRLWRQILTNLAYAGLSEVAVDMGSQWLGAELMTKLSARAGQGLGAGLLTARLGYQVMQLTRPVPFHYCKKPGFGQLQKDVLKELAQRLPSLYRFNKTSAKRPSSSTLEN